VGLATFMNVNNPTGAEPVPRTNLKTKMNKPVSTIPQLKPHYFFPFFL
jgi:hypothetical protein